MKLGYNTNGMAHHRLNDAIALLAEEGYQSIAITLDAGVLDPYADPQRLAADIASTRERLDSAGLGRVIETGARYVLNPRKKHDPTLLDPDPERRAVRVDFLKRSIAISAELGSPLISFWSGILPDRAADEVAYNRLVEGIREVLVEAEKHDVALAFEPEPGMFIDTMARFAELDDRIRHELFQLTVDIGHVHCIEEGTIGSLLQAWPDRIINIHIEDMKQGVHDHLMFGEGTIDFDDVFAALTDIGYAGGIHVELSRHSHMAVEAVRRSAEFLKARLSRSTGKRGDDSPCGLP